jgi:hypothetical protein
MELTIKMVSNQIIGQLDAKPKTIRELLNGVKYAILYYRNPKNLIRGLYPI